MAAINRRINNDYKVQAMFHGGELLDGFEEPEYPETQDGESRTSLTGEELQKTIEQARLRKQAEFKR